MRAILSSIMAALTIVRAAPAAEAASDKDVTVTNTAANPVPVSMQGRRATHISKWAWVVAFATATAIWSSLAAAQPQQGWWWNPDESGRGFFIESQNGIFYLGGYFYSAGGQPVWMVAGAPNTDPYNYSGRLLSYGGGQTLFGAYVPPVAPTDMGAIVVHFSDDTHGTINWAGGTIPIQRFTFGSGITSFQPETGWWWNPDESGSGYSIELQGNTLFVIGYMYDASGNPTWYLSAGPVSSSQDYQGSLVQFANGQTLTGPYQAPTGPVAAGMLNLQFSAQDAAILTITDTTMARSSLAPQSGHARSIPIRRTFTPHYVPPASFQGIFAQTDSFITNIVNETSSETLGISATVDWIRADDLLAPPYGDGAYYPTNIMVNVHDEISLTQPGFTCTGAKDQQFGPISAKLPKSEMTAKHNGTYSISLLIDFQPLSFTYDMNCIGSDFKFTVPHVVQPEVTLPPSGTSAYGSIQSDSIVGAIPLLTISQYHTRLGAWNFKAVR